MRVIIYTSIKKNVQWDSVLDMLNGRSKARNRVVAKVFKELGLIEQWGIRLNRIIDSCKEQGLNPPKIEEKNDFFDIELYRPQQGVQQKSRSIAADYDRLQLITTS